MPPEGCEAQRGPCQLLAWHYLRTLSPHEYRGCDRENGGGRKMRPPRALGSYRKHLSPTGADDEQFKRNADRFTADFLFQLISAEKTEVVTNCDHLARLKFSRTLPYAFTMFSRNQSRIEVSTWIQPRPGSVVPALFVPCGFSSFPFPPIGIKIISGLLRASRDSLESSPSDKAPKKAILIPSTANK